MPQRVTSLLVALAVISAGAFAYMFLYGPQGKLASSTAGGIGGPFQLTSQNGQIVDSANLVGKPYAIFFGFTHCPEVCPTTLSEISRTFDELGDEAKGLPVFFVTVDPERDTPDVLKEYMSNFSGQMTGLWGTPEQIAEVAKAFKVFYEKVPTSDGGYTMNHTAFVYLMDKYGRFRDGIGYAEDHSRYVAKFRQLIEDE